MKYSEETQSFYDLTLDYPELPDDLIDVSEEDYQAALTAREAGKPFEFIDGKITVYEKCPGEFYEWNSNTKTWTLNQEKKDAATIAANEAKKSTLLTHAKEQIDILTDELDLDLAEDINVTKARLKAWKVYRIAVNNIDTANLVWPVAPEN